MAKPDGSQAERNAWIRSSYACETCWTTRRASWEQSSRMWNSAQCPDCASAAMCCDPSAVYGRAEEAAAAQHS
eukprot:2855922-Alexandrium_andersonii.AAC.1